MNLWFQFIKVMEFNKCVKENKIELVGAVHDFNCPETGKGYLFFPVRKLN